jgi:uncharacterized protein
VPVMPFQVIPRERVFFDLFEEAADGVAAGAVELVRLIDALPDAAEHHRRIRELEHAGDDLTHRIMETLNTSFVTPFDRHDIHRLASLLDDVLDAMEAVADLLVLHRVDVPLVGIAPQAEVLVRITALVVQEVRHLRSLSAVERDWGAINRLEREGDRVFRRATAELFSGEHPAMEVLKWKDIVDQIEDAIDGCESISNTIEGIALKYS